MSDPILSIRGLRKTYGTGVDALKSVDLDIQRGEIFALLGPNGAGKTTLINIICGIVTASGGEVLVDGDQLALADDSHTVGHFLGLLDIMGGEDDRGAVGAKLADQLPHVAAKLDVDSGGRLVEEQERGLVAQRLGDHHPALHAAGQEPHFGFALVP